MPVNPVSFGGPDDWAAATNMDAMVEGLAGVKNALRTEAFNEPVIAPRWITTQSDAANVTIRYAASEGYVCYQYRLDKISKSINLTATTGGNKMLLHILLPANAKATSVTVNNQPVSFKQSFIEQSGYADFEVTADKIVHISLGYK